MITFNGIYLKNYMKVLTTRWSVLPPQKNTLLSIPQRAGSYFIRKEDDITTLEVDIAIIANSTNEIRSAVRNIASLLYTDTPAPLVLDSEPNMTYYAILDGKPDVDKLGRMGTFTLTFICPDPYGVGEGINQPIEAIDPTFARTSTAYKSDGTLVASGIARFEYGYFHNLLTDNQASASTDTTGMSNVSGSVTIARDATKTNLGNASFKVTTPGLATYEGIATSSSIYVNPNDPLTFSAYLAGYGTVRIAILEYGITGTYLRATYNAAGIVLDPNTFQRASVSATVGADCYQVKVQVNTSTVIQSIKYWVNSLQLEKRLSLMDWILPSLGKGLFIEDTTTNVFPAANQTFATGWAGNAGATPTVTQAQTVAEWGATDATRIQTTGGTNPVKYYCYPFMAQTSGNYVGQMKVKNNGSVTARVALVISGIGSQYQDIAPGEQKTLYFILPSGGAATTMGFAIAGYNAADNLDIICWRPQIEYGRTHSSTWHTTTRQPDSLSVANQSDIMNATEGSIVMRYKPDWNAADMNRNAVLFGAFGNGGASAYYWFGFNNSSKKWVMSGTSLVSAVQTFVKGTNLHFSLVWTETELKLYLNGLLVSTVAKPANFQILTNYLLYLGCYSSAGNEANGTIDDFAIFSKALDDAEILAIATATSPIIPDQYTTYQLKLNNSLIATFNNPMQRLGSALSYPIFQVKFKAVASELKILQNETGKYVRVVKSFVSNDVLVIDCNKNLITINGVNSMQFLDLYSDFIELISGTNTFTITPDNVATVSIDYQERWL